MYMYVYTYIYVYIFTQVFLSTIWDDTERDRDRGISILLNLGINSIYEARQVYMSHMQHGL